MRVGIVTSAPMSPREGIGHFVINLGHHLVNKGHSVIIATRGRGLRAGFLRFQGLDIYLLPYLPIFPFHVHFHGIFLRRFLQGLSPRLDVLDFQTPLYLR